MTIEDYKALRRGNLKTKTLQTHRSALNTIFNQMKLDKGEEPTPVDVRKWLVSAKDEEKMKSGTIAQYMSILKSYWRTLGLDDFNELQNIAKTSTPTVSKSDHEYGYHPLERVTEIIEESEYPFDLAIQLGYTYARRLGEVRRITARDVTDSSVDMPILKKTELKYVTFSLDVLPEKWRETLLERKEEMEGYGEYELEVYEALERGETLTDPLFPFKKNKISWEVRRVAQNVGAIKKDQNFHSFRHSRIIHLKDRGVPSSKIRELTRHAELSTLEDRYGRKEEWKGDIPQSEAGI